jgi:hypothetical protein
MKKSILMVFFVAMATLFAQNAFSQTNFEVRNESGFQLYGLMVSQDGGNDWSADLLPSDTFDNGTTATVTIPEGYTCQIYIKVSYQVDGATYEEVLARADVCSHGGIRILSNPNGSSGHWMTTQYLN